MRNEFAEIAIKVCIVFLERKSLLITLSYRKRKQFRNKITESSKFCHFIFVLIKIYMILNCTKKVDC